MNNVHFKGSLGFIDTVCGSRASASLLGQLRLFVKENRISGQRHVVLISDREFYKVASSLSTNLNLECPSYKLDGFSRSELLLFIGFNRSLGNANLQSLDCSLIQ